MIISNRAQDEFNHAMWKILEKNKKLKTSYLKLMDLAKKTEGKLRLIGKI